ncbi:MAG: hypothetical protein KAI26_07725 [Nanoarchaeota archaeon]|nr:hypothetical protein [Nanoarchaeota archaeon]
MINKKDMLIISNLRKDARMNLTKMAKKTGIPVSTIFDKIRGFQNNIVTKHTTLINFDLLGYNTRSKILLKVGKEDKEALKAYLLKNHNINSFYRINNGYDFMIEGIFKNIKEMEEFLENLEGKFTIEKKEYFYIIDDMKREAFMEDNLELMMV